MAVEVRIPTILRKYSDGAKSVEAQGSTVRELFSDLEARYPGISGQLLTEDGGLHRFVNVYVNDEDIRFLGALDAKLDDGDVVAILPAVAGGSSGGLKSEAGAHVPGSGARPSVSPPVDWPSGGRKSRGG
jgi:MoaD family protein